jgi:hypothetical protein
MEEIPSNVTLKFSDYKISENILKIPKNGWYYYRYIYKSKDKSEKSLGKYLFFSKNFDILEKIAIDELENNGFNSAKINGEENKKGSEFVLCIYYANDSRKDELTEKYRTQPEVRCGFWKSNKDTSNGKYSEKFLENLSLEERSKWTNNIKP